jgi:hypothetical protein
MEDQLMIDIHQLFYGLTKVIDQADFPNAAAIAIALDMDLSIASVMKTDSGTVAIHEARLDSGADVGIISGLAPRRSIWLMLLNPAVSCPGYEEESFGSNQRIEISKFNDGAAILFEQDGWICGLTVSLPGRTVRCLFCEEPRPLTARTVVRANHFDEQSAISAIQHSPVSCDFLLRSDWEISHSAPFASQHFQRGLCVEGALRRNKECLADAKVSRLLPY